MKSCLLIGFLAAIALSTPSLAPADCALSQLAEEHVDLNLSIFLYVQDNIQKESDWGRDFAHEFYAYSPEIARIFSNWPHVAVMCAGIAVTIQNEVRRCQQTGDAFQLSKTNLKAIKRVLRELERYASLQLGWFVERSIKLFKKIQGKSLSEIKMTEFDF